MNIVNVRMWSDERGAYRYANVPFDAHDMTNLFPSMYENTQREFELPKGTFFLVLCGREVGPTEVCTDADKHVLHMATVIHCVLRRVKVWMPDQSCFVLPRKPTFEEIKHDVSERCGYREYAFSLQQSEEERFVLYLTFGNALRDAWIAAAAC